MEKSSLISRSVIPSAAQYLSMTSGLSTDSPRS